MVDWDSYVQTGMVNRQEAFENVEAGAIKTTYSIDTDSGRYILQTSDPGSEGDIHLQREVYQGLDSADVPVPAVVYDAAGGTVPYQVVEYVPGRDMDKLYGDTVEEPLPELTAAAGRYLATAHQELDVEGYGHVTGTVDGLQTGEADSWRTFFHDYMTDLASLLHGSVLDRNGLADDVDTLLERVQEEYPTHPESTLCHRDYRPGNLRVRGDEIVAVLDWDNAIAGDAYYDYVRAEISFADRFEEKDDREELRDAFSGAYRDVAGEKMQPERYEIYRFCARVDKAAGIAYLAEKGGYEFEDWVVDAFHDAVRQEVEALS